MEGLKLCEKAQHILQEQEDSSAITEMARIVVREGRDVIKKHGADKAKNQDQCEKNEDNQKEIEDALVAVIRMSDMVYDHPRLKLEMKELALEMTNCFLEEPDDNDREHIAEIQQTADMLRANIQAADEQRWADIRPEGHLKHDPVEWTRRYEEVIDEANRRAYANLKDVPRGMGFCFGYWHELRTALHALGVEWRTPTQTNPGVLFD